MQNSCIFIFKAYSLTELKAIKLFSVFLKNLFKNSLEIQFYILPKKSKKFTVIRSPHVFKSSREQFEIITYKVVMKCNIVIDKNKFYLYLFNIYNKKTSYLNQLQSYLNVLVREDVNLRVKF
jgi:ribosomal protein S10